MKKYNLETLLGNITKSEYPKKLELLQKAGLSRHNFYQWKKIKLEEKRSMPLDAALKIASILNIDIQDLHNLDLESHSTASD